MSGFKESLFDLCYDLCATRTLRLGLYIKKFFIRFLRKRTQSKEKAVCVRAKKNKRDFSLTVRHIRIIVIDLIIVKLFRVCSMIFPF